MSKESTTNTDDIIKTLIALLTKANAHAPFDDAVSNIPFEDLDKKPNDLPYSIWQLTEHIRFTQHDILDFSTNINYKEHKWPDDYWVKENAPANEAAWKESIASIKEDLKEFIEILKDKEADLTKPFEHGDGQTLLREAMLIADHTSYHTGEIILLRRLLGNWKKS